MKSIRATNLRKTLYKDLGDILVDREPVEIVLGGQLAAVLMPPPTLEPRRRKPPIDLDAVSSFCKKHSVRSFALFGSILRDDFDEESDVDVLVDLGRSIDFHEECRMLDELEVMFGRAVDMVERSSLERIDDRLRSEITSTARTIYEESSDEAA
jgi:predicted nucleotidyltransferase